MVITRFLLHSLKIEYYLGGVSYFILFKALSVVDGLEMLHIVRRDCRK